MSYTFRFIKPDDAYYESWRKFRRRSKTLWLAILLSPLVTLAVFLLSGVWWIAAVCFLAPLIFASLRVSFWPCPRCGRAFYTRGLLSGTWFVDKCLHCGLPEYSPCDVDQVEWFD